MCAYVCVYMWKCVCARVCVIMSLAPVHTHRYVERGLPIAMIVIDWFHWVEMGDFGLKPQCWPDPQAMVDELRTLGIELMVKC